jgi:YidC/Oxa1 family membrane protein insertase
MDKNFVIGLVLIMLMLIGYQVLVPKPVEPTPVAEVKKEAAKPASVTSDTTHNSSQSVDSTAVPQKDLVIETKDTRVVFTNKGGVMKEVMLKNYKTYDQKPLYLIAENHNKFQIDLPTPIRRCKADKPVFHHRRTGPYTGGRRFGGGHLPHHDQK